MHSTNAVNWLKKQVGNVEKKVSSLNQSRNSVGWCTLRKFYKNPCPCLPPFPLKIPRSFLVRPATFNTFSSSAFLLASVRVLATPSAPSRILFSLYTGIPRLESRVEFHLSIGFGSAGCVDFLVPCSSFFQRLRRAPRSSAARQRYVGQVNFHTSTFF